MYDETRGEVEVSTLKYGIFLLLVRKADVSFAFDRDNVRRVSCP